MEFKTTEDGGFVIIGNTLSTDGEFFNTKTRYVGSDIFLMKFEPNFSVGMDSETYGGSEDDRGT